MSRNRTLTKREITTYAQVLLEAAQAANNVFEVAGELPQIRDVIRTNPALRESLTDATLPAETRGTIAREVFGQLSAETVNVFAVMAERLDTDLLDRLIEQYEELAEENLGVVFLDVTTVVALDDELRGAIKEKYAAQFGKPVMLREHVDKSILGGIVLGAHGQRVDASAASALEQARVALTS